MDNAEHDVLAFMSFPKAHRTQIHSTNPLERLNAEIKRRTDVVGIFPNDASITRLVGALLLEQNDEWSLQRRYMQLEGLQSLSENQAARLSAVVAEHESKQIKTHDSYTTSGDAIAGVALAIAIDTISKVHVLRL
jgi:putative transposase